jgi:hypothetical protein
MDKDHEDAHSNKEVLRAMEDDNGSERYWCAVDELD